MLPLRTVRNSDKGGDLRETHENWDDPAVGKRKFGRPKEVQGPGDLRKPHGNRDGSDLYGWTVGRGVGREARSGLWRRSRLSKE